MGVLDTAVSPLEFTVILEAAAEVTTDTKPTLQNVADEAYYPMVQLAFETEGHGRWPQLAPATLKRRGRFIDRPMLQVTGRLMDAITQRGADGNIHEFNSDGELVLGASLPEAFAAAPRANSSIERLVIDPQPKDYDNMAEAAAENVANRMTARGLPAEVE